LIDVQYRTGDGFWHRAEVVDDGYYGAPPPTFVSETADPFDPTDPIGSRWHELHPNYCNYMTLESWFDNGDQVLSASDQIDMLNETDGWLYWWHVDDVTVTIHFTFKPPDEGTGDAEPVEPGALESPMIDPIGSTWHMIYPDYSREFVITSWEDSNGNQAFDASDQFDFEFYDEPGVPVWAHLDSVTTDIILTFKDKEPGVPEFPLGIGLMIAMAPAIPVVYLWRRLKKEGD
jgi:hypothetical protein